MAQETARRNVLGRGLAALIDTSDEENIVSSGLRLLPIEKIQPNRSQPRKYFEPEKLEELAQSIRSKGVLQPILVRRINNGFEIVAGERRWRAAAKAGLHEIPALVRELADTDALQIALIENIQRQDLDPLEEAEALRRLIHTYKLTHEQVATAVGKSRMAVTNSLRLLELPQTVLDFLADGRLTAGHARALMGLRGDVRAIEKMAADVVQRKMSVRELEQKVRMRMTSEKEQQKSTQNTKSTTPAVAHIEQRLQRILGTKVRMLIETEGKGKIEIVFHSAAQREALLDKLLHK